MHLISFVPARAHALTKMCVHAVHTLFLLYTDVCMHLPKCACMQSVLFTCCTQMCACELGMHSLLFCRVQRVFLGRRAFKLCWT